MCLVFVAPIDFFSKGMLSNVYTTALDYLLFKKLFTMCQMINKKATGLLWSCGNHFMPCRIYDTEVIFVLSQQQLSSVNVGLGPSPNHIQHAFSICEQSSL